MHETELIAIFTNLPEFGARASFVTGTSNYIKHSLVYIIIQNGLKVSALNHCKYNILLKISQFAASIANFLAKISQYLSFLNFDFERLCNKLMPSSYQINRFHTLAVELCSYQKIHSSTSFSFN